VFLHAHFLKNNNIQLKDFGPTYFGMGGFGLSGRVMNHFGIVESIVLSENIKLEAPWAAITDPSQINPNFNFDDGIIGYPFLQNFDLIFDYQNDKMYLKPITGSKIKYNRDLTGMFIRTNSNFTNFYVASLVDDSPADIAGLVEGDKIISIDGKSVSDFDGLDGINEFLRNTGKSTILISYERDGNIENAKLNLFDMLK
ncbi:MAG: PDZ domain-containing protein, partial [Cyclobacteriaceae bacterium]